MIKVLKRQEWKNKYFLIILLFVISLIFLTPLFNSNFYLSHDGEAHVARFAAYYKAFSDGQFPPRWAGDLNSGYGSPLFIFFYPLPGYIASFFHSLGIRLELVFKLLVYLSFSLTPIFLFLWLRRLAKDGVAFAASIVYIALPYRFLDTYVRGDIAELISFTFIPLIFLFIDKSLKEKKLTPIVCGGLAYGLFILSHNAIATIFSPVFIAYSILLSKKLKQLVFPFAIFFLGIILSTFFWLPSIVEGKFVYAKIFVENIYKDNFISPWNLFYAPWGFGPDINVKGGQSPQIGILHAVIPFLALFLLNRIREKREIIFWLAIFLFAAFMTTNYSRILWEIIPVIRLMGYPWRFTALSGFASAIVGFYILKNIINKKILLFSISILFLIFSVPFLKANGYVGKNDAFYYSYQGTTDYHRRTSTIWTEGDFWKKSKSQFEIISGSGEIKKNTRTSILHTLELNAGSDVGILDNTVYFPGWRVEIDGNKVPIEFQDQNHRGLITFNVPRGRHFVKVYFGESPVRLISDLISLAGLVLVLFVLFFRKRTDNKLLK